MWMSYQPESDVEYWWGASMDHWFFQDIGSRKSCGGRNIRNSAWTSNLLATWFQSY